ncbi:MAG: hypothetical protein KAJ24_05310, partial [Candidatus Aenigmarchaeota archaeon]|nr:hypothetical protein [Candidatus Aenigmarchaeota archaeon]
MVNQQIINWIKQQDSQGYSSQQLYNYLIQQGYNPNEVNEAIRIVSQPTSQVNQLSIIIIGIVVVTLICGGMIFLFSQNDGAVSDTEINSETDLSGCDVFPNRLESCEPFSCKFEHPFTGEIMDKKIIGLVNGKCQYTEEMP